MKKMNGWNIFIGAPKDFADKEKVTKRCLEIANENDKIKVTKKGKIKTTKIGYFFDCQKIV